MKFLYLFIDFRINYIYIHIYIFNISHDFIKPLKYEAYFF